MTTSDRIPKTILLRGNPVGSEAVAAAGSAIKPGMLLRRTSTGDVEAHGSAAGAAGALFAREASMVGRGIEDTYPVGDTVVFWNCRQGDHVYAFLEDEANVAIGDYLESAGDGSLQARTGNFPVAQALEAVNNVGGTGMRRIKVEVL